MKDKFPTTDSNKSIVEKNREFEKTNYILIAIGISLLIIGYVLLAFVNSDASNFPGYLSPFIIFISVLMIIIALIIEPEK